MRFNVYTLTFVQVINHPAKSGQEEYIERGPHQTLNIAAVDGAEAEAYVRENYSPEPNGSVQFIGGPALLVADVVVFSAPAPAEVGSGLATAQPSAADLDAVEAENTAAAATEGTPQE